jgi:hypothetical protein
MVAPTMSTGDDFGNHILTLTPHSRHSSLAHYPRLRTWSWAGSTGGNRGALRSSARSGQRSTLTKSTLIRSLIACECDKDHTATIREELVFQTLEETDTLPPGETGTPPKVQAYPSRGEIY